jgi:nitrous oxide reductase accessory protein NosL
MGSNTAAFRDKAAAEKFILRQKGQTYTWDELFKKTE